MRRLVCAAGLVLAFAIPSAAHATLFMTADATGDPGYITLTAVGNTDLQNLRMGEQTRKGFVQLGPAPTLYSFGTFPGYGELGQYTLTRATTWQCSPLTRNFVTTGTRPDGTEETGRFSVRTPSCDHRFSVDAPLELKPGRTATVLIRDTFEAGDTAARFCRRPPDGTPVCKLVRFAPDQPVARVRFSVPTVGRWKLSLGATDQHTVRTLSVGVEPRPSDLAQLPSIVTAGDSLMQGPNALLEDRLDDRAVVHSDVRIGSGLTKTINGDWTKLPAQQVQKYDPQATVLFLGANDDSPIDTAAGENVACCDATWIAEYVRRVKIAMRTYTAGGRSVFWLTIPTPEQPFRRPNVTAVNAALVEAVKGMPRAHLIDLATVFTPGDVFRSTMTYQGKRVRVRQPDGIHLTVAGSNIADTFIIRALEQNGIL